MATLRYIIRGCGYLDGYGEHPGTPFLIAMVVMGFVAGAQRGLLVGLIGAGVMLAVFGSMYLCGAHDRGRSAARRAPTTQQPRDEPAACFRSRETIKTPTAEEGEKP